MNTLNLPLFECPSETRYLWRYMDFHTLLWILQNEKLHFSSPTDDFDDNYETTIPKAWHDIRGEQAASFVDSSFDAYPNKRLKKQNIERQQMRDSAYVSCWHSNQKESAAMWELYGSSQYNIAIRTTVEGLKSAFEQQDEYVVGIGDIQYVDFDSDIRRMSEKDLEKIRGVQGGKLLSHGLLLLKREEYAYEKEVRCIVLNEIWSRLSSGESDYLSNPDINEPVNVPVDVNQLIEEIRLPPEADDWFAKAVTHAVENNRNTEFTRKDINRSQISHSESERYF